MDEILKQFPPPSVNNSRAYIQRLFKRFKQKPSDLLRQQIENLVEGISIDHSDSDWGNSPKETEL